jgi:hypothetical protein
VYVYGECAESIEAFSENTRKGIEAYPEKMANSGLFAVNKIVSKNADSNYTHLENTWKKSMLTWRRRKET